MADQPAVNSSVSNTPVKKTVSVSSLREIRTELESVRREMREINVKMDAYDRANPGQESSPEAQKLEAQYEPLRKRFETLRAQETESEAGLPSADIGEQNSLPEVQQAMEQVRTRMQALNRRYDSTNNANYGKTNSVEMRSVAAQLDNLNDEYQRLSGLEQNKLASGTPPAAAKGVPQVQSLPSAGASKPQTSPAVSPDEGGGPPQMPATTTAPADGGAPETTTNYAGDSYKAKIDFVDITIYISIALLIDLFGLIPLAGEIISFLGIMGFRLWFWLKGLNDTSMNWLMGILGFAEVVPVVSELLPGVTAYVAIVCGKIIIAQRLDKVAPLARAVARSPMAPPQVRAAAALVAAGSDVAQGQDAGQAVAKEGSSALSGGMSGGTATASMGASASQSASTYASKQSGASASFGDGSGSQPSYDFSGGKSAQGGMPAASTEESGRFAGGSPTAPDAGPQAQPLSSNGVKKSTPAPPPTKPKPAPKEPVSL